VNPAKLSNHDKVQLCAQCHRSPANEYLSLTPELDDPSSIRFAPVGLMASACFRKSQKLDCVTCHDPHDNPKPASDLSYVRACKSCHATQASRSKCKRGTGGNCVECHMQKSTPLPLLTFTDHRIRVYPQ
jgi:hypothetical protein